MRLRVVVGGCGCRGGGGGAEGGAPPLSPPAFARVGRHHQKELPLRRARKKFVVSATSASAARPPKVAE